jgi:GMP synthase (glutamine-hydrolysing)
MYKARIKRLDVQQNRKVYITLKNLDDPLFEDLTTTEIRIQKKHQFNVTSLREPLISLAHSDISQNEIIRHRDKTIYGFQGHPEVSGRDGLLMMRNFLRMCGFDVE